MTGLPTFTVKAPYGSLIRHRVKRIETRSWATKHRGRVGVHQGKRWAPGWRDWLHPDDWRGNVLDRVGADLYEDRHGSGWYRADRRSLPLGALLATADLTDCLPILDGTGELADAEPQPCVVVAGETLTLYHPSNPRGLAWGVNLDDQLPYGTYTPGGFAWLLDDIQPTTDCCPACGGFGDCLRCGGDGCGAPDTSRGYCTDGTCPRCGGAGRCDPIPAKGRERLWRWEP